MKNFVWKHRIVLGLLVILSVQVPFVAFKLTTAEHRDAIGAFVEIAHILLTSGLAGYLFSKAFESWLDKGLYGRLRQNWREVRVMYSDGLGKGTGEAYPREPTLLIQAHPFDDSRAQSREHTAEDPLFARSQDGSSHMITAPLMHSPMSMSFNNGYVGQPAAGESTFVTGKWSELQLMRVGLPGMRLVRAGFPDTLVTKAQGHT